MSVAKPAVVVLAAGMGSRYGGLKQIDPVGPGGETLLDYSIFDAVRAGFDKVIFVIRRDIEEAFVAGVGAKYENVAGVSVAYAFQELDDLPGGFVLPEGREKPWGTGHATLAAKDLIDGPFAVINADDFYGARAYRMLAAAFEGAGADYAMVGYVLRDTLSDHGAVTRGLCRTDEGYLTTIEEIHKITRHNDGAAYTDVPSGEERLLGGDETVSMNFWGFVPAVLPQLEAGLVEFLEANIDDPKAEYLLPDRIDHLVAEGQARVRVLDGGGPWFGVTYQEDREGVGRSVRDLIAAGDYPERLWG